MFTFVLYLIILTLSIGFYSFFILKKSNYPVINLYLIINVIIYYIPALLYVFFGLTHPGISFNNNYVFDYRSTFIYGVFLILFFDILLVSSYLFFQNIKFPQFSNNAFLKKNDFEKNFKPFFFIVFFSACVFDFLEITVNNPFMNKDNLLCNTNLHLLLKLQNFFHTFEIFNNIKQVISVFSNLKFYLLIITLYFYTQQKKKYIIGFLLITLFYNFVIAIFIGSKFNLFIVFLIFFCIYYNYFLNLKNIIFTSVIFYLSLYIFPLIGAIRTFYTKSYDKDNCTIVSEKIKHIIETGFKYNNLNLNKNDGLINQFQNFSYVPEIFTQQSFLNKPLEIILSRLNYFDITLRAINLKLNKVIENNFSFYFDNIYSLIPRLLYPDKKIILNKSNYLAVDLGIINQPINSVGLRPIAEGFFYIGYYYFIIAIILGFIFYFFSKLFQSTNILIKSSALYISILILKRDSFHSLIPGIMHELVITIYLLIIIYILSLLKNKKLY